MISDTIWVAEAADYCTVLPASNTMPGPPRFTFGAAPAAVMSAYFRATSLHGIGVYAGTGLAWCGGFILDAAGSLLIGGDIQIHPDYVDRLTEERRHVLAEATPCHMAGTAAALVPPGEAYRIYGHWLVDILPKLAVLDAAGHDVTALHYPVPQDTPAFAIELMTLLGVPRDRIVSVPDGQKFLADRLLLPTSLHNGVRVSPLMHNAAALFHKRLNASGHLPQPAADERRIFLARRGRNRALVNRGRIEEMARQGGFAIVYPEERSLLAQFALFTGAREILGEYGSAFHTALFSPPGTVVCGLRGDQFHPAFIQSGLGAVLDQPTGYVFGTEAGDEHAFVVAEDAVRDCLATVFDRVHGLAAPTFPAPHVHVPAPPTETLEAAIPAPAVHKAGSVGAYVRGLFGRHRAANIVVNSIDAQAAPAPEILVLAHLQSLGDTTPHADGWAGMPGSGLAVEGVVITIRPPHLSAGLNYRAVRADGSLSKLVPAGAYCGTRGRNTPIHGIVLHTDEPLPADYAVFVDACFLDGSHRELVPAGVACHSDHRSPLEALRVVVVKDGHTNPQRLSRSDTR